MTLLAASGRRRETVTLPPASEVAPYASIATCVMPPYPVGGNNLSVIHPSVLDFGQQWNGYRWWMANTPYPPQDHENPCIYVSNDRVNWIFAPGAPVPIDPTPPTGYNSDVELVRDDTGGLVCYYRHNVEGGVGTRSTIIYARQSPDGSTWGPEVQVLDTHATFGDNLFSPAVLRLGPGDFHMWGFFPSVLKTVMHLTAPDPFGPWTEVARSTPSVGVEPHGCVLRVGSAFIMMTQLGRTAHSLDGGGTWVFTENSLGVNVHGIYRATLQPSAGKPGWIDIWHGGYYFPAVTGATRTVYTRVPLSFFGL